MIKLKAIERGLLVLLLLFGITACDKSSDDPCADTIAPQVHVDITFKVRVVCDIGGGEIPVPGCKVRIRAGKYLCEGGVRGDFMYDDCYTNTAGEYQITVGYNLHNTEDKIRLYGLNHAGYDIIEGYFLFSAESEEWIDYDEAEGSGGTIYRTMLLNADTAVDERNL